MAESNIPAWIALFMGLYSLAAALGELLRPGNWAAMFDDFARSAGLRFLTGILCIALGAAIYLVTPWQPGDWLSVIVSVIGGGMAIEGFVILAFGERFLGFARALIANAGRAWALFSAILGIAFVAVALIRL